MFAAIGLGREAERARDGLWLASALPWRPPGRGASEAEVAMLTPFLRRHIVLAAPELVVCMGGLPCRMLLGQESVAAARGRWLDSEGRPALAIHHPVTLMRRPQAKREAWADLLSLRARLAGEG
jgi:DNA polymerase